MALFFKSALWKSFACKFTTNLTQTNRMVFMKNTIPAYLMDRTKPASDILKKLQPDDRERLRTIQAEFQNFLEQGEDVPSKLEDTHLLDLLCCPTYCARLRLYRFLFVCEKKHERKIAKKEAKVHYEPPERDPAAHSRILRIIDEKAMRFHEIYWQLAEMRCPDAAQPLIFDFTHESEMRLQDQKNLASQMVYVMNQNRAMKPHPFHLVLCGLKPNTNQYAFMEQHFSVRRQNSSLENLAHLPWTISPNHFAEDYRLGNPERPVILLSPNAHRSFEPGEWDHNAAYVIGAVVDKTAKRPVTFAKARMLGVDCVRLPLERYLKWSPGRSKTLTINCIHAIMATAKRTNGDWETALKQNVPKRFYV